MTAEQQPTERRLTGPVWFLYDEYRTSRLSIKCYCHVLERIQRWQLGLEIVIALCASGTALAAFAVWGTAWGKVAWQVLATIAAALAIAKPFLKYDNKIQQ